MPFLKYSDLDYLVYQDFLDLFLVPGYWPKTGLSKPLPADWTWGLGKALPTVSGTYCSAATLFHSQD